MNQRTRLCLLPSRRGTLPGTAAALEAGDRYHLHVGDDKYMGIFDGAANGLKLRLEAVGVPSTIACVMGQVAYIAPRNRHPGIPEPIVTKSEVTWLVSQYETELRQINEPLAVSAMVQGLCVRVFGHNAEAVFVAGYPELSSENLAAAAEEAQSFQAMMAGMLRYFDVSDPAFQGDRVMLPATYIYRTPEEEQRWHGIIILWDGHFGFFEESDWLAEDTSQGCPILFNLRDLERCTILKPEYLEVATGLPNISVQGTSNNFSFTIRHDGDQAVGFGVRLEDLPTDNRSDTVQNFQKFLSVVDRALALNIYDART